MADEELTQAEMEALLTAARRQPICTPPPSQLAEIQRERAIDVSQSPATHAPRTTLGDRASNSRRPSLLDAQQLRALINIHETFARGLGQALAGLLRWNVDVRLSSLGEIAYGEFAASLEDPTCLNVLSSDALSGNLLFEISPAVAFPMIDRMLGGGREPLVVACRPLTQIESRLVARVTALAVDELAAAWRELVELTLAVDRVVSNPRAVEIVSAAEPVVLARFEIAMHGVFGGMRLCIPRPALAAIKDRLTPGLGARQRGEQRLPTSATMPEEGLRQPPIRLVAELADCKLTAAQLAELSVGDIITTDADCDGSIVLRAGDAAKFHAQPGSHQGHRAVKIESVIDDDE